MKKYRTIHFSLVALAVLFTAAPAFGDGILIPGPYPLPRPIVEPEPMFSVKYHRVSVEIDGQEARTSIDQVFKSESGRQLEATYLFPVPENAAIDRFSMKVDGETVEARLLGRDEARNIYESIVRHRKDPALLEYAGRGLFRARVFPVEPYGEKKIELAYQQLTDAYEDTYRYVYPLDTERFSTKPIENVSIHVKIKTDDPLKNIYSSSHQVSVRRINDREAEVSWEETNGRPARDFELFYSVSRDDVGISLLTHRPGGEDGYFLLLGSPRYEVRKEKIQPKDVLFVFDRTGSMSGEKIDQAREALKFCLRSLNENDRFNVIPFNERPVPLFDTPEPANRDNIDKALALAGDLEAMGGTNIDGALETALPMAGDPARPTYILFLTDGLPTVGVTDIKEILDNAKKRAPAHLRLFVFGVGYDVNTHLLDKLTQAHSGMSTYIRPGEDLEVKVSNMFRMISDPVLTDVALDMGAMGAYDLAPLRMPDIFKGTQLVVTGRFRKAVDTRVTLSGTASGEKKTFSIEKDLGKKTTHGFIPTLWATRRIGILLDEIRLHGEDKELVDEVVRLSKKYGIITEYTSFLVEEPGAAMAASHEMMLGRAAGNFSEAKAVQTGRWAVDQAVAGQAMSQNAAVSDDFMNFYVDKEGVRQEIKTMQNSVGRAFYLQEKTWTDNLFDEKKMKVVKIKNFSDAMFQLLDKIPELGPYFAQGDSVLVAVSGALAVKTGVEGMESFTEADLAGIVKDNRLQGTGSGGL